MKSFRIAFQSGQNLDEVYAKFCMDAYGSTGAPFRTQDDLADILSSAKLSLEDARRVTVSEAWAFAETEKTDVEVDGEDWQICVSNVGPSKTVDHAGAVDAHVRSVPTRATSLFFLASGTERSTRGARCTTGSPPHSTSSTTTPCASSSPRSAQRRP